MRKIFYIILAGLVAIQFFRPARNTGNTFGANDIAQVVRVPEQVMNILEKSCFDCHSNHTEYPWYTNVQPIGWWMQHHVDEGREELNFSEFKTYSLKKQLHKLEESAEMVEEGEMPLDSYTRMHSDAELNEEEKEILLQWISTAITFLGGQ